MEKKILKGKFFFGNRPIIFLSRSFNDGLIHALIEGLVLYCNGRH